jgi:hypothetical protein
MCSTSDEQLDSTEWGSDGFPEWLLWGVPRTAIWEDNFRIGTSPAGQNITLSSFGCWSLVDVGLPRMMIILRYNCWNW